MNTSSSIELLQRWQNGDEQAAHEMFNRYVDRLIGLARTRLSKRMQRRIEPEDVVQSAYRSFFRKAGDGQFSFGSSGDLWRLLAAITIMKVRGQVEFHTAKKRGIYLEVSSDGTQEYTVAPEAIVADPSPEDATVIIEELQALTKELDSTQRQILELSLQNASEDEISEKVKRSGRTVRRTLKQIRETLEERLHEGHNSESSG